MTVGLCPLHGQQDGAAPFAADADALNKPENGENDGAPYADMIVPGNEGDQERGAAHEQECCDQRGLAAEAVAIVAEDGGSNRPGDKPDRINTKRLKRTDEGIGAGEKEAGEDESGDGAVKEEVVPFDG